jgi:hypothetical protein
MEVVRSAETSVNLYQDFPHDSHCFENFISNIFNIKSFIKKKKMGPSLLSVCSSFQLLNQEPEIHVNLYEPRQVIPT